MRLLIAGTIAAAIAIGGTAAIANNDGPTCHTKRSTTTESRAEPGGISTRQVTTLRTKCGNKVTVTVNYGPWS